MKVLSLFSGIGAFEKALERKGIDFELVNYCEFDKYASKSYSLIHNVSETMNLGDITKVNISELKSYSADLITYGFPCQDISNAGKQRGFEYDGQLTRSGLFFYASKIIGRVKPKVAICENVKALTSKRFTKEFDVVLSTLEDMGYRNYWQVLNAKDYGIPQNRERVFIVSIRNDIDKKYEFPASIKLGLRLKDILEKEVDEKYYLSDKMLNGFLKHNENHEEKGTGFKWKPRDIDGVASCLRANAALAPTDNTIEIKPERIGGIFDTEKSTHQAGSIWDKEKISPTIDTEQRLEPKFDGTTNTLITVQKDNYVAEPCAIVCEQRTDEGFRFFKNSVCGTLRTIDACGDKRVIEKGSQSLRIRKLTPKECFRLMGFDDNDVDILVENKISNTQLYKQAGNSIVVNVLEAIFENLKDVLCD